MRIGVDVGGTNTDAVLIDGPTVLATTKKPTTNNISDGIVSAIRTVLENGKVPPASIQAVMIGTTHFTNAFVERRGLTEVGAIRIALPAAKGVPPKTDWPVEIADAVGSGVLTVRGGYQCDGRINSELDEATVQEGVKRLSDSGVTAFAVSGLFSPVNASMEEQVREIILGINPEASVTLSAAIGRLGLLERENAAIMNASLAKMSGKVVQSFSTALRELEITAPFFISQNDGTLMSAEQVAEYPVLTFASGPTNSMRGAAYLSGVHDAIVADIGGTTTDIGVLKSGFPRISSLPVDIGGVRTNFRMPDILAIGLGGGSIVSTGERLSVGPRSVGYNILKEAMVFGGSILTATDIAVAAGVADIGDKHLVGELPRDVVSDAVAEIHAIITEGVDRMKTSGKDVPLILVGGGSILVTQSIPGTSETISPQYADVANAVGASIAQVGGETDKIYYYDDIGRDAALEDAQEHAFEIAIKSGAELSSISVTELEEVPLDYVPGGAVRVRLKVTGDLDFTNFKQKVA